MEINQNSVIKPTKIAIASLATQVAVDNNLDLPFFVYDYN